MFDYLMMLKDQELDHGLSNDELRAAIDHLGNALQMVLEITDAMNSGVMDITELAEQCEKSWNELNKCRLYTEKILFIEELIIPAMGQIYDAKVMFDSLVAWKLGMTVYAARSIWTCLRDVEVAVRQCLDEMVSWLEPAMQVPALAPELPTEVYFDK